MLKNNNNNDVEHFIMPELSALTTMPKYPINDIADSVKLMTKALKAAQNFRMPDLSALTAMPKYPINDIADNVKLMTEALKAAQNFRMPDLSALTAMSKYPINDIADNVKLMAEALKAAQEFRMPEYLINDIEKIIKITPESQKLEKNPLLQENYILSNEVSLQIKEYIEEEISKQMKIYTANSEKKPTNFIEYIIKKQIHISIFIWVIQLLLSPVQALIEDEYKDVLFYFIERIETVINEDKKYIELYEKGYDSTYQIVTKNNLPVKKNRHNQSETLGYLSSNRIVKGINNKKDWTKIQFTTTLDDTIEGWVYTRYTTTYYF